jgi:predicted aspartyl protease
LTGQAFGKFPTIFVRLEGRSGGVKEFVALIDPGAEYCIIPKVDAYSLGYPEAANDDPRSQAINTVAFTSYVGHGIAALIKMARVELGQMSFKNIDFLAFDIPQVTGFDVVLGLSLLQFMKLEFDYSVARLRIEETKRSEEE